MLLFNKNVQDVKKYIITEAQRDFIIKKMVDGTPMPLLSKTSLTEGVEISRHAQQRIAQRLKPILTAHELQDIENKISVLENMSIEKMDSIGLSGITWAKRLMKFKDKGAARKGKPVVDPETHKISSFLRCVVVQGNFECGDEVWAVVRDAKIITIILIRSGRPLEDFKTKFRVDKVVK